MMEPEGNQFRIDDHPLGAPMSEPVEKRIVCQMVSEYEAFRTYWMPWIEKGRDEEAAVPERGPEVMG